MYNIFTLTAILLTDTLTYINILQTYPIFELGIYLKHSSQVDLKYDNYSNFIISNSFVHNNYYPIVM